MIGAKTGIYSTSASGGPNLFADATAAYSLRDLGLGATNAIRVRRSSDDAEQDIPLSNFTSALTTFVGAGDGSVVTWYDQSGNGNDATQSTSGNQPKIVDDGVIITKNSWPAILCTTLNGGYLTTSTTIDVGSSFSVANYETLNAANYIWGSGNAFNSGLILDGSFGGGFNGMRVVGQTSNYELNDGGGTSQGLFTYIDSTNTILARNGNAGSSTNVGLVKFDTIGIRSASSPSTLWLDGTVSELIFYPDDKSSNRVAIESNINDYYNIF